MRFSTSKGDPAGGCSDDKSPNSLAPRTHSGGVCQGRLTTKSRSVVAGCRALSVDVAGDGLRLEPGAAADLDERDTTLSHGASHPSFGHPEPLSCVAEVEEVAVVRRGTPPPLPPDVIHDDNDRADSLVVTGADAAMPSAPEKEASPRASDVSNSSRVAAHDRRA